ncbi:MAG: BolA family transcriptional regulator [Deltaproteobacteria bacterium]|nr:BolA family transcriptional regulator [Deltaproteobacteria bacterium]
MSSSDHPTDFKGSITEAAREAIERAIPGAKAQVEGGGGHYRVTVISSAFEGKSTLQKHRMVLNALAPMMSGDMAPVHAVDSIDARTA